MSVNIFGDQVTEERAENARMAAFVGAIAVGDLVKSTLGPKGMDKLLQSASSDSSLVTNDGATILKSIPLDNPAAKVLVNISKVQDDEVGDGTTSVTVLSAELLREAEKLIDQSKIHPQTIIEGYRIASQAPWQDLRKLPLITQRMLLSSTMTLFTLLRQRYHPKSCLRTRTISPSWLQMLF